MKFLLTLNFFVSLLMILFMVLSLPLTIQC